MLIRLARFFVQLNVPGVLDVSINREPRAKHGKQKRNRSTLIETVRMKIAFLLALAIRIGKQRLTIRLTKEAISK